MKGTMWVFPADSRDKRVVEFDHAPRLEELKAAIDGGWLESVPYFNEIEIGGKWHRCWAVCDEEGKLKGLGVNPRATMLWHKTLRQRHGLAPSDILVGPVFVIFGDDELMATL